MEPMGDSAMGDALAMCRLNPPATALFEGLAGVARGCHWLARTLDMGATNKEKQGRNTGATQAAHSEGREAGSE